MATKKKVTKKSTKIQMSNQDKIGTLLAIMATSADAARGNVTTVSFPAMDLFKKASKKVEEICDRL